jgi:cytochrome c5
MEMKRICIAVGMIGIAVGAVVMLCSAAYADDGAAIYKTKCAMCHGPDGKGDTSAGKAMKVQDLASEDVQKMSDSDFGAIIFSGKGKMPSYKTLTPDQVKELVGYVRSLGKESKRSFAAQKHGNNEPSRNNEHTHSIPVSEASAI